MLDEERATVQESPFPQRSTTHTMSRRSLRLHVPHLEHGSPYGSASFSMGMPATRESISSSSRRPQLSVSCSLSLLHSPRRRSHLHSVASDASLLSSMLDESSILERTLVDNTWGLDYDLEPTESTILSEHNDALANSTLISGGRGAEDVQVQTSMVNVYPCRDCSHPADGKEVPLPADRPTSGPAVAAASPLYSGGQNLGIPPTASTIYYRDKSRKRSTGVGVSLGDCVKRACRRTMVSLSLLLILLYNPMPLKKQLDHRGVLHWILAMGREALALPSLVLNLGFQVLTRLGSQAKLGWDNWRQRPAHGGVGNLGHGAPSRSGGSMDSDGPREQKQNSTLWQIGATVVRWLERGWYHTVSFMSLLKNFLLVRCLPNLFKITLLLLLLLLLSMLLGWWDPRDVLPASGADWREALPLASIPGLAALLRPPPETTASSSQSAPSPPEQSTDLQAYTEPPPPQLPPLPPPPMEDGEEESDKASPPSDPERLQRLEQSLSRLWEHVEVSEHRAEQMHGEVLGLYQGLRQQQLVVVQGQAEPDRAGLELWLDGLLDDKLADMRVRLEEDRALREQTRKQYIDQQKSQASHLAELEQLLQALTAKMEQLQQRQEAVAKATTLRSTSASRLSTSVGGVDRESHDVLRSDVSRLEVALGGVRQDLKGLSGCQDHCDRLDHMEEMILSRVHAQVREELRALLYGNQLVSLSGADPTDGGAEDQATLPDSLLQWLADRFVSGADLRASLAALELSILHNVSRQLLQQQQQHVQRGGEPGNYAKDNEDEDDDDDHHRWHQNVVTQAVEDSLEAAGVAVTEEQVQLMVNNALRLYSQDRTGLADYALESGGGSILSTRCSESYETRTALLSLFGLPLWYFSQSPRVVIQPDVHPGNCWAFRGPTGYLVIRLSMKIVPTAFSLEHIPKALAPSGALRSAPRDFTIYGLEDEAQEEGQLLGRYSYEEDGEALQMYTVTEESEQAFQIIEVRILSNWGNPEYTCMYRLRVHGRPSAD